MTSLADSPLRKFKLKIENVSQYGKLFLSLPQAMTEITSVGYIAPRKTVGNEVSITQHDSTRESPIARLQREPDEQAIQSNTEEMSRGRLIVIVGVLFGITTVGSFSTGLLTVGLPRMATDLQLAGNLLIWYAYYPIAFFYR